jgi:hypothetical protein
MSDFQDGALPAAVAEELSGHLHACGACAEVARTLEALRDRLRHLPPLPAPPGLLARVQEAVARESAFSASAAAPPPARPFPSRIKVPLQAAAVVLLFASVYWYQTGSAPPPVPGGTVAAPRIAPSASPPETGRTARQAPGTVEPPPAGELASLEKGMRMEGVSTLPPGTPEPKVRIWSRADLPAAPALRAGTDAGRIVPGFPARGQDIEPGQVATAEPASRRETSPGSAREVLLEVAPEDRILAEERIAAAVRNLGGTVEGTERAFPDVGVSVRVLLPEQAASAFLERLARFGKIPPDGMPAESGLPAGQRSETVAYTVHVRVR